MLEFNGLKNNSFASCKVSDMISAVLCGLFVTLSLTFLDCGDKEGLNTTIFRYKPEQQ